TETELTCHRRSSQKRHREGPSSLIFAATAGLPAASTSSPSLKLATRTCRARSGGKNPSISPASARRSRALDKRGWSSGSADRTRSILAGSRRAVTGSQYGDVLGRAERADYPDLGPVGEGEVGHFVGEPPAGRGNGGAR